MKSDPNSKQSTSARARAKRAVLFGYALRQLKANECASDVAFRILDIGGTLDYWRMNAKYLPAELIRSIEVVNLPPMNDVEEDIDGINVIAYGGNALDRSTLRSDRYDVIHSNSVIEHVGNLSSQKVFADTVTELADFHFIQTPCRTFPIEPHFFFPYFALLPLSVRAFLYRHLNLGFMGTEPDWLKSRIECEETRLLSKKECASLFPDSNCLPERMYLMTKSWMMTNMANKAMQRTALRAAADL